MVQSSEKLAVTVPTSKKRRSHNNNKKWRITKQIPHNQKSPSPVFSLSQMYNYMRISLELATYHWIVLIFAKNPWSSDGRNEGLNDVEWYIFIYNCLLIAKG
jgi:hypothetical protein